MGSLRRTVEIGVVFVVFPLACLALVSIWVAVGLLPLAVTVGAMLAAWLFSAYFLPLVMGVMAPSEIAAGLRSRRRRSKHYEGEPLPDHRLRGDQPMEDTVMAFEETGLPVPRSRTARMEPKGELVPRFESCHSKGVSRRAARPTL